MTPVRRVFALLFVLGVGAAGCVAEHKPAPATNVRVVEIFAQGADASSPLVVWIHGRGGRPERFGPFWRDFPAKVDVVLPQAFIPMGDGWSWFEIAGTNDSDWARAIGEAEEKLWPTIAATAHGRKVIVGGFSQGGILAYLLAERHPDEIAYAFPIAGGLPDKLLPRGHAPRAPVYAMHGTADNVIDVAMARQTIAAFQADDAVAELKEFPGVGHTFTDEMGAELTARVKAAIAAEK